MNTIDAWTAFFGWCTVVNIGIYLLTVFALTAMRDFVYRINGKIFKISEGDIARVSFQYVGAYKLIITVFCFVPWVALKIVS